MRRPVAETDSVMSGLRPIPGHRHAVTSAYARALRRTCVAATGVLIAMLLPGDLPALGPTATAHQVLHVARWTPSQVSEEPYITPKAAATTWVEEVGSWDDGVPKEVPDELREPARTSRTVVLTAQLADSPRTETSVIVIARQVLDESLPTTRDREVALQIDLLPTANGWTAIPPPETTSEDKPDNRSISLPARRVLGSARIALSAPARRDVEAGVVDDRLLGILSELACRQRLDITVFVTGYRGSSEGPPSQHGLGRAVDLSSIDGQPITPELAEGALGLMQAANGAGAVTAGPILIDGASSATNPDHIHIGVS